MRTIWSKYILIALVSVLAIGGTGLLFFKSGLVRWTLTVATGPALEGGPLFMAAVNQVFSEERPHVRLQRVHTETLEASAKALETGAADLALVRSDIAMPKNGLTIAIFRRDSLVLVVSAHSHIDSLQGLAGKKVGLLKAGTEEQDLRLGRLLDAVLGFYNISPRRVERVLLSAEEVGAAVGKKEVAGVLALGPAGPGPIAKLIASVTHATKAPPGLIGDKQAEAMAKAISGVESNEIEAGAFGGTSPRPEEELTTLAVTYRLVARHSLPDFVAGEIARLLFLAKASLLSVSPLAMQIEAPDSEDGDGLPVHPGAAAFFSGEQASLVDSATSIFYLASIVLGIFGSAFAWLLGEDKPAQACDFTQEIARLLAITREVRGAGPEEIDKLDDEIDGIVERCLARVSSKDFDAGQLNALSIVIRQARQAIEKKLKAQRPGAD